MRAPNSQPGQASGDKDLADEQEQDSAAQAPDEPERQLGAAGAGSRLLQAQAAGLADAAEEPSDSSSAWSSEGREDEAGTLGQMAQSMLAALGSSQHEASHAAPAAWPQHRLQPSQHQSRTKRQLRTAAAVPGSSLAARGRQDRQGEERRMPGSGAGEVAEIHWNPAVQLPSLQSADGGRREEILGKTEPVPAGQVRVFCLASGIQTVLLPPGFY